MTTDSRKVDYVSVAALTALAFVFKYLTVHLASYMIVKANLPPHYITDADYQQINVVRAVKLPALDAVEGLIALVALAMTKARPNVSFFLLLLGTFDFMALATSFIYAGVFDSSSNLFKLFVVLVKQDNYDAVRAAAAVIGLIIYGIATAIFSRQMHMFREPLRDLVLPAFALAVVLAYANTLLIGLPITFAVLVSRLRQIWPVLAYSFIPFVGLLPAMLPLTHDPEEDGTLDIKGGLLLKAGGVLALLLYAVQIALGPKFNS